MPTGHGDEPVIWPLEDRSRRRQSCSFLPRSESRARRRLSLAPHSVRRPVRARAELLLRLQSIIGRKTPFSSLSSSCFLSLLGLFFTEPRGYSRPLASNLTTLHVQLFSMRNPG